MLPVCRWRSGNIRYANAEHNPPYLCSAQKVVELRATGLPSGIFPNMIYEEKEARLADFAVSGWEQEDDITMVAARRVETDPG